MWLAKAGSVSAQLIDDRLTGYIDDLKLQGYIETTENQDPLMVMQADGSWSVSFQLQSVQLTDAVTDMLEAKAKELRYSSVASCRSYAGFVNTFQAEALTVATWSSDCWAYMDTLEANILNFDVNGDPDPIKTEVEWVDVMPTVDELLASLPVYVGVA